MPYEEFAGWFVYFEKRPPSWQADLRAAYIMQAFGVKKKPEEIFQSLESLSKTRSKPTLISKNSFIYEKLLNAKNGDQLKILEQL